MAIFPDGAVAVEFLITQGINGVINIQQQSNMEAGIPHKGFEGPPSEALLLLAKWSDVYSGYPQSFTWYVHHGDKLVYIPAHMRGVEHAS